MLVTTITPPEGAPPIVSRASASPTRHLDDDGAMKKRGLLVLLVCLAVATIGFGITLPVLPFYAERLALRAEASAADVAMQVGLLTAIYPMVQLVAAPIWGHWSDRVGRRRLVLIGIGGAALAQLLFGLATTLPLLYGARLLGGMVSSAIFPAASAYVADSTTERERSRGMAWLGTALSLGAVMGPALGAALARTSWEWRTPNGTLLLSSFAVPFFAAALLALIAMAAAMVWLPESRAQGPTASEETERASRGVAAALVHGPMRALLGLALAGQFGLALFESVFALYAKRMWRYGPAEVGVAFAVCGVVMAVAQAGAAAFLARRVNELAQVAVGFGLVAAALALMPSTRSTPAVLTSVGILALGIALISPNIASLISARGGGRAGAAFGAQSAANSLGQVGGTLAGGALLAWEMEAPFALAASLLLIVATIVAWWSRRAVPAPVEASHAARGRSTT